MAKSVAENVKKIREVYEFGLGHFERTTYGKGEVEKLAAKQKLGQVAVYRARQFARMFSKKDVERLCKLRCRNRNSLSWGHIIKILKVRQEHQRWKLLELAAKHDWSTRDLEREVDMRFPKTRKYSGGKPKTAADAAGLVQQISRTSESWLRFDDQLRLEVDEVAYRDELPPALRDALRAAYAAMRDLYQTAESVQLRATRKRKKK
jgi:hypothetical protein